MKTIRNLLITALLVCVCACLTACGGWEKGGWQHYSLDFSPGSFRIQDYEDGTIFTPQSKIELSMTEPSDDIDGFVACVDGVDGDVYFIFYDVADDVKSIEYDYIAERSVDFRAEKYNGDSENFTLYAYDWTDRIYCMAFDILFVPE